MFTPTLCCECAQPGLIDTMRNGPMQLYRPVQCSRYNLKAVWRAIGQALTEKG